jgi:hypothetical protein
MAENERKLSEPDIRLAALNDAIETVGELRWALLQETRRGTENSQPALTDSEGSTPSALGRRKRLAGIGRFHSSGRYERYGRPLQADATVPCPRAGWRKNRELRVNQQVDTGVAWWAKSYPRVQ